MIVVVEGPSAAGKTTWSARFPPELVVPENGPVESAPIDPVSAAAFWADPGARRWALAEKVERARIGFADRYYVAVPDAATLAQRKAGDASRRRRNFELHSRLREPLREWYAAIEELRPGSVTWSYPAIGDVTSGPGFADRYSLDDFNRLVAGLVGPYATDDDLRRFPAARSASSRRSRP